jgi:hypothetical protein
VSAREIWVIVDEPTMAYSLDDEPLGEMAPGETYPVLTIEDGWALAVTDVGTMFWLELGDAVETMTPDDDPTLGIDPLIGQ